MNVNDSKKFQGNIEVKKNGSKGLMGFTKNKEAKGKEGGGKAHFMRIAVVIALLIIPLAYSLLYLGAFWDPYAKMENIPVAVVNEDQGATIDGKSRNLGEEITSSLMDSEELKFVEVEKTKANQGVEDGDYYAAINIPQNFSLDIASASKAHKVQGNINYKVNEKKNFLGAQVLNMAFEKINKEVVSSIDESIADTLAGNLKQVPVKLTKVSNGFDSAVAGSKKLADGASKLQGGAFALRDGGRQLAGGIGTLDSAMGSAKAGVDQILEKTKGLDQLAQGAKKIDQSISGEGGLKSSVNAYTAGVGSLIDSSEKAAYVMGMVAKDPGFGQLSPQSQQALGAFLGQATGESAKGQLAVLKAAGPKLNEGVDALGKGASQLSQGAANLPALSEGLTQLQQGIGAAKAGTAKLNAGAQAIVPGTEALANGAGALSGGANELASGLQSGKSQIDGNISKIKKDTKALDGIGEYAAEPVNFEKTAVNPVPNYGTAFAPYFMSLSLWVGGLILFVGIYLDIDRKFPTLSRDSDRKVVRSFGYLALGLAQAIVLALVIKYALGLEVYNMAGYIGACCLVSMVFISIIQFCIVNLGDAGKLIAVLLLILQLTSCGGTFPMETVPEFFNVLYPFMPMTYSVALFKEAISGTTTGVSGKCIAVLVAYMVVMMAATILLVIMKKGARQLRKAKKASGLA